MYSWLMPVAIKKAKTDTILNLLRSYNLKHSTSRGTNLKEHQKQTWIDAKNTTLCYHVSFFLFLIETLSTSPIRQEWEEIINKKVAKELFSIHFLQREIRSCYKISETQILINKAFSGWVSHKASPVNALGRGGETMIKASSSGEGNPAEKINSPLTESRKDSWRRYFKNSFLGLLWRSSG